jgi:hypothetical protein
MTPDEVKDLFEKLRSIGCEPGGFGSLDDTGITVRIQRGERSEEEWVEAVTDYYNTPRPTRECSSEEITELVAAKKEDEK